MQPLLNTGIQVARDRSEVMMPEYLDSRADMQPDELELLDISNQDTINRDRCVICIVNKKDTLFYPCGHESCCNSCAKEFMLQARFKICPICRDRIVDIVKVYR